MTPLIDTFGRTHNNLRISVTDRCNLRCFYCMPADNVEFMPRSELLSFEEIHRIVRIAAGMGISKLRLTGGEPLVRRDLADLVRMLSAIDGIDDLGLTTNALLLEAQAEPLYAAGLRRINISLDALDPVAFKTFTRREGFEQTLAGIRAAQKAGFEPVKINAVAVRGFTESQIVPFGQFARESGLEVRFIEYMPLDASNAWERDKVLFAQEIIETLSREIAPLEPVENQDSRAPATDFRFSDGVGRIGFISSVSQPFCQSCNRLRLTAEGKIRNCLFSLEETDLRGLLRGGQDDEIAAAIRSSVLAKKEGHEINTARFIQPLRPMYSIGG
jgi:GTP 3',8-cyclase